MLFDNFFGGSILTKSFLRTVQIFAVCVLLAPDASALYLTPGRAQPPPPPPPAPLAPAGRPSTPAMAPNSKLPELGTTQNQINSGSQRAFGRRGDRDSDNRVSRRTNETAPNKPVATKSSTSMSSSKSSEGSYRIIIKKGEKSLGGKAKNDELNVKRNANGTITIKKNSKQDRGKFVVEKRRVS